MSDPKIVVLFDLGDTLVNDKYQLMPGARELVEMLSQKGIILGIVSGSKLRFIEASMAAAGLKDKFAVFVGEEASPIHEGRLGKAISLVEEKLGPIARFNIYCIDDRRERADVARQFGVKFIGVATGELDYESFRSFTPRVSAVFRDLTDTERISHLIITGKNLIRNREKAKC